MSSFPEKADQLFVKLRTKKSATRLSQNKRGHLFTFVMIENKLFCVPSPQGHPREFKIKKTKESSLGEPKCGELIQSL